METALLKKGEGWATRQRGADPSPARQRLWMREMFCLCFGLGRQIEGKEHFISFIESGTGWSLIGIKPD
jgi:hypothetical protein